MKRGNKKGQVTIFVIIAVVIVAAVLIFFFATDTGRGWMDRAFGTEFDVEETLKDCIEGKDINDKISLISSQGGSVEPTNYYLYDDTKFEYLCQSSTYLDTCIMQQPMLLQHVESEIESQIEPDIRNCFNDLKKSLERRGYDVSTSKAEYNVDLIPENIVIEIDSRVSVSRGDESRTYEGFEIKKSSGLYELIMLATSILNYEARYGDSTIDAYMAVYPDIRVEKLKQGDGTTLYYISNRNTGESFNFASKSLVYPEGYFGYESL